MIVHRHIILSLFVLMMLLYLAGVAGVGEAAIVPSEDRYAALKDLDCQMKSQQQQQQQGTDTQTATQPDWSQYLPVSYTHLDVYKRQHL